MTKSPFRTTVSENLGVAHYDGASAAADFAETFGLPEASPAPSRLHGMIAAIRSRFAAQGARAEG